MSVFPTSQQPHTSLMSPVLDCSLIIVMISSLHRPVCPGRYCPEFIFVPHQINIHQYICINQFLHSQIFNKTWSAFNSLSLLHVLVFSCRATVFTNPFLELHELTAPVINNASLVFVILHVSAQSEELLVRELHHSFLLTRNTFFIHWPLILGFVYNWPLHKHSVLVDQSACRSVLLPLSWTFRWRIHLLILPCCLCLCRRWLQGPWCWSKVQNSQNATNTAYDTTGCTHCLTILHNTCTCIAGCEYNGRDAGRIMQYRLYQKAATKAAQIHTYLN